jgi:hypothetical protein
MEILVNLAHAQTNFPAAQQGMYSTSTGISTKRSSGSNLACHTATNREQQA